MLNYVITVAISAFFVPHYIGGLFWPFLKTSPGDIIFGIGVIVVLCAINVVGVKEAAGAQRRPRHHRLLTQLLLVILGLRAGAVPAHAGRQRAARRRPTLEELPHRDPGGDDRLHGHRDDLEHGRGGQGRVARRSRRRSTRGARRVRDLRAAARGRAVGAAGHLQRHRPMPDAAGAPREPGRVTRATRCWESSSTCNLGPLQHAGEIYVGLLAATILFIATNAGIIGVSRLVYSMGLHRQVPDGLRRLHPQLPHAVDRDHPVRGDRLPDA